jgi:outer membrane protein assembly factor BamB
MKTYSLLVKLAPLNWKISVLLVGLFIFTGCLHSAPQNGKDTMSPTDSVPKGASVVVEVDGEFITDKNTSRIFDKMLRSSSPTLVSSDTYQNLFSGYERKYPGLDLDNVSSVTGFSSGEQAYYAFLVDSKWNISEVREPAENFFNLDQVSPDVKVDTTVSTTTYRDNTIYSYSNNVTLEASILDPSQISFYLSQLDEDIFVFSSSKQGVKDVIDVRAGEVASFTESGPGQKLEKLEQKQFRFAIKSLSVGESIEEGYKIDSAVGNFSFTGGNAVYESNFEFSSRSGADSLIQDIEDLRRLYDSGSRSTQEPLSSIRNLQIQRTGTKLKLSYNNSIDSVLKAISGGSERRETQSSPDAIVETEVDNIEKNITLSSEYFLNEADYITIYGAGGLKIYNSPAEVNGTEIPTRQAVFVNKSRTTVKLGNASTKGVISVRAVRGPSLPGVDGNGDIFDGILPVSGEKDFVNAAKYDFTPSKEPGDPIWEKRVGSSTPPTVVNGTVYVGTSNGIYSLNASSGNEKWIFESERAVYSPPTVRNGTVYGVGATDTLYGMDAGTGKEIWNYTAGGDVDTSPTVVNGTVYFGSDDNNLYALNAETGNKEWNYTTGGKIRSEPTAYNGTVYFGSNDKKVYALDPLSGEGLWNYTTGGAVESSPTIYNGTVYVGSSDSNLYALNAQTGKKEWSYKIGDGVDESPIAGDAGISSSPTVWNGTVYVGTNEKAVYAIDARTGKKEWNYSTEQMVYSSPTVANGTVYAGSADQNLYALDTTTGEKKWEYNTGTSYLGATSPTVVNGTVYVGSDTRDPGRCCPVSDIGVHAISTDHNMSSQDSRVLQGTLGHHGAFAKEGPTQPELRLNE